MRGTFRFVGALCTSAALSLAAEPAAPAASQTPGLKVAPPNTWVKVAEEPDGWRNEPIFYYVPAADQFVMTGGTDVSHFETETFDLPGSKWLNSYPAGAAYKSETGAPDAPRLDFEEGRGPIASGKDGVIRFRINPSGYGTDARTYFQWTFDRDGGRLYAYLFNSMVSYDPVKREWTDLKTAPFSKGTGASGAMIHGALAYDPVNKEVLSVGGTSAEDGGTPGSWAYAIGANSWKKIETGSKELRALWTEGRALEARTLALVNACRNRFYACEGESEAKADLSARAGELATAAAAFAGKSKAAKLTGNEAKIPARAAADGDKLAVAIQALSSKLGGRITPDVLVAAQEAVDFAASQTSDLAMEPCGRAGSQMATDYTSGKIVLFGGTRLDCCLSDTWVYDCKTRTWEQRYPAICPSPRAWHTLAWLPKSGQVALWGGAHPRAEGNQYLPELWVYDLKANTWKLLVKTADSAPAAPGAWGKTCVAPGAADSGDVLVVTGMLSEREWYKPNRLTWTCRVDASAADAGSATAGVVPGARAFGVTPQDYDKATKPDAEGVAKILKDMPANQWTLLPKPPRGSGKRDWGTVPYDTDRHQILHWGGGHSTYKATDVAHYSLQTATWSIGYPMEDVPPGTSGFNIMAAQTFQNRPHVPCHVWDATAYDPVSKKGVWMVRGGTWTYDPASRAWSYPPAASIGAELHVSLASTPRGVACWTADTLSLFDAKSGIWTNLPLTGGKPGVAYGDSTGMCYDAKRNCLWLSNGGDPMMRYDMADGTLTTIPGKGRPGCFMRETVYVPEVDMLVSDMRVQGEGAAGNLAYDIENQKWVGLDLSFSDKDQRLPQKDNGYWPFIGSRSLHYDPVLKLLIFFYTDTEIALARLDKASLKTFEVKLQEPKK